MTKKFPVGLVLAFAYIVSASKYFSFASYHAESVFQALFSPHLCYLKSFIHLMLCNYYIISVMIMLYYATILEMQFIAIYDND